MKQTSKSKKVRTPKAEEIPAEEIPADSTKPLSKPGE